MAKSSDDPLIGHLIATSGDLKRLTSAIFGGQRKGQYYL
jgi:hypothetical protein